LLQSYADHLSVAGFNDVTIYSIFNQAARDLSGFEIVPQESDRNSKFKIGFYANQSLTPAVMTEVLVPYLAEQDTQLILSTHNTRTFIDVLPSRAGKGMAMRFLARHLLVRTSLGTYRQTFRIRTARQTFLGVEPKSWCS
jgi:hydroxymethylpyrimidine pyrophosphatase-like HAD family hydrolase